MTQKPSAPSVPEMPDPGLLAARIMTIAARSRKIMESFLAHNRAMMEKMPSTDPGHIGQAFVDFMQNTLADPRRLVEAQIAFWQDYVRLLQGTLAAAMGQKVEPVIMPDKGDKRFADPVWQESWVFDYIKQSYLLAARYAQGLIREVPNLDPKTAHKVRFYASQMIDSLSPNNFWMTNPEVLRTTLETRGENLIHGLENLLKDMERGHGQLMISMTDASAFHFGKNIASTEGKVVFQNELIQLIQYAPLTDTVHKTPFLITPPWINKYYILDLKPENSFIRHLVEAGHTVFCISWVNPDTRHAAIGWDDYMTLGPMAAAIEVARITGEKSINILGYCIAGTLLSSMLAWLERAGDKKPADMPAIASATYLTTMIDFTQPGDLGVFIDEEQIQLVEAMMKDTGYLPAPAMGSTFAMMRANDLVWSFVINNYLLGRDPFPFDLLAWNSDSTNLPATMQSFYLRNMYLENNLIKADKLTMKGLPIDLRVITTPTFCLAAQEDHIAPWRSVYAATQTYKGPVTFCLAGSGHIAGVINPPEKKKYGYWTNEAAPSSQDEWLKGAVKHEGSWWPEWYKWLAAFSGEKVPARAVGTALEDAPGSYVKVKAV